VAVKWTTDLPELYRGLSRLRAVAPGAFIKGMFDVAVANAASKIIQTADGTTLEAPGPQAPQRTRTILPNQLEN